MCFLCENTKVYFKGCGEGHEGMLSTFSGTGTDQTENISTKMAPVPVEQEMLVASHLSSLGPGPQFLCTQQCPAGIFEPTCSFLCLQADTVWRSAWEQERHVCHPRVTL